MRIEKRHSQSRPGLVFVWVVAATWAALTLYFPVSRSRVPVSALLTVVAGAGIAETRFAGVSSSGAARR